MSVINALKWYGKKECWKTSKLWSSHKDFIPTNGLKILPVGGRNNAFVTVFYFYHCHPFIFHGWAGQFPYGWQVLWSMANPIITCILCRLMHLAILHINVSSNILLSIARQRECHSWRKRGAHDDYWVAHCCWHFLCWMWLTCGMEIRKRSYV